MTTEESLCVWSGYNVIPSQVIVQAKKGSNSVQELKHGTSVFNFTTRIPDHVVRDPTYGLNVYPLSAALLRCSPDFYVNHPTEVRACLNALQPDDDLAASVLEFGGEAYANRLIGALRAVGRDDVAKVVSDLQIGNGRTVKSVNPFSCELVPVRLPERSPSAARIRLLWQTMRKRILEKYPEAVAQRRAPEDVIREMDEGYVADSYHSLSIEGYRVTEDLIRRVRDGDWNPDEAADDRDQLNALAASGYYRAYQR